MMDAIQHLAALPMAVLVFQRGHVVYANAAFHTLFRTNAAPLPENPALCRDILDRYTRLTASGQPGPTAAPDQPAPHIHTELTRRDGSAFHAELSGASVTWNAEPALQLCIQDVTGEQHALTKLHSLASGSIEGILIHRDMRPLFVNDAYAKMYGYDSKDEVLRMQSILQFTDPEDRDKVWGYYVRRMKGEKVPSRYVHRSRTRDGRQIYVDNLVTVVNWEGQPAVQVTNLDVTQYVTAQTVAEWERQAVFGEVAAGMAKRFVQHSSSLSAELEQALLHAYMEGNGQVLERMRAMQGVLQRMQGDLDALLVAARDGSQVEHPVSLSEIVTEAVQDRLRPGDTPSIHKLNIQLSLENDPANVTVRGDRLHIRRVINSILDNATEAMPHGGTVNVSLRPLTVRRPMKTVPQGRYALIEVTDEGSGIDPAIQNRIGEPFQSTKDGHAGIGLSTSLTVMERHRGYLTIDRAKPHGTRVCLFFPVLQTAAAS